MLDWASLFILGGFSILGAFLGVLVVQGPGYANLWIRIKRLENWKAGAAGKGAHAENSARFGMAIKEAMELYQAKKPWAEIAGVMLAKYPDVSFSLIGKIITGQLKIGPLLKGFGGEGLGPASEGEAAPVERRDY